ncbi:MAG: hypothetical protein KAJ19_12820 [Gammaproteobacteria bacterium]|nr:hypothetical protein [Gammaproteobacteria bacterium]
MATSKKQTPKVGDLVEVYWLDHSGQDKWVERDAKDAVVQLIECRSIGWVQLIEMESLCLYASETDRGCISQQCTIVRSCITSMKVLRRAKAAAPHWSKK